MNRNYDVEKFNQLYDVCFDENDNVRPCGRKACQDLLIYLGETSYGDIKTGFMNTDAIISLHTSLNCK